VSKKWWVSLTGLGLVYGLPFCSVAWQPAARPCPYLDGRPKPFYEVELGIMTESSTANRGSKYAHIELNSGVDLVYFHDIAYGDLDFSARFESIFPTRKSAFDIPPHLMALVLEARWFWRYVNDTALELTFEPGFYASTEDVLDMPLAIPVRVAGVYTPDPSLALVAGMQMRPSFADVFIPYGGVVWSPHAQLRVDAVFPDARVTYHYDREWSGYAGWKWDSTTYTVQPDDEGRNRYSVKSQEWYVGASWALYEELRLTGSLGWLTDREIRKTRSRTSNRQRVDVDDSVVLRVGIAGAF
jgi:hypothetical protein